MDIQKMVDGMAIVVFLIIAIAFTRIIKKVQPDISILYSFYTAIIALIFIIFAALYRCPLK